MRAGRIRGTPPGRCARARKPGFRSGPEGRRVSTPRTSRSFPYPVAFRIERRVSASPVEPSRRARPGGVDGRQAVPGPFSFGADKLGLSGREFDRILAAASAAEPPAAGPRRTGLKAPLTASVLAQFAETQREFVAILPKAGDAQTVAAPYIAATRRRSGDESGVASCGNRGSRKRNAESLGGTGRGVSYRDRRALTPLSSGRRHTMPPAHE